MCEVAFFGLPSSDLRPEKRASFWLVSADKKEGWPPGLFEVNSVTVAINGAFSRFPRKRGRHPVRLRVDLACFRGFGVGPVGLHFGYFETGESG